MPSDSTNDVVQSILLGRPIIIHRVLGGGKVADVLLWRNTSVSAALLIGMTVIWFIFGVVEYNWVILLYHLSITTLLIIFILQFVKIFLEVIFISAIIPSFRSNAIIFLYMLPVIGTYLSSLNLLYLGFIYLGILLPLLFERFEDDVTRLGVKIAQESFALNT
ncbi:PREDICTED: reticulon [Prunus dulcis]|uniref:Reticulon-like protein n=1 Tax=Prunus dulcis TaxID=3755 RepID=A0A5E4G017_PRUDU|nr:PREDICTED: reticulon [Prunus dulcis]